MDHGQRRCVDQRRLAHRSSRSANNAGPLRSARSSPAHKAVRPLCVFSVKRGPALSPLCTGGKGMACAYVLSRYHGRGVRLLWLSVPGVASVGLEVQPALGGSAAQRARGGIMSLQLCGATFAVCLWAVASLAGLVAVAHAGGEARCATAVHRCHRSPGRRHGAITARRSRWLGIRPAPA